MAYTPLNSDSISLGPGLLYIAAVGATEPTDLAGAWDAGWTKVGYTKEGHTFTWDETFDGIFVAESKPPVLYDSSQVEITVAFEAAEITLENFQRAMNGGTVTAGTGVSTFTPRSSSTAPAYIALGWESDDGEERFVVRKALQTDTVEISRKKSPDYATVPMTFKAVEVAGLTPFKHIFDDSRVAA
jgi:hypothetical protein